MLTLSLVLPVLVLAQTSSKPPKLKFPPPKQDQPRLCEIGCSCKFTPGVVDTCAGYWAFKIVNPGDLIRYVNDSPAACRDGVEANLKALGVYYLQRPEFSLPTQDMGRHLNALSIPMVGPLPDSRKLDTVEMVGITVLFTPFM